MPRKGAKILKEMILGNGQMNGQGSKKNIFRIFSKEFA